MGNAEFSLTTKIEDQSQVVLIDNERRISLPNFVSGDFQALDSKVKSMMEKSTNLAPSGKSVGHLCKVCGKEGAGIAIRDHIEAKHLEELA